MKTLLLALVALAPAVPFVAHAAPGTVDAGNLPPGGVPLVVDCGANLDKLVAELQTKSIGSANATLLVGSTAFAESPVLPAPGGFNPVGGSASLTAGKIVGTSRVATPGANSTSTLSYTIAKVAGKAKLSWTHQGKSYSSRVDACSSGYWTAATATSAIQIHLKLDAPASPPA